MLNSLYKIKENRYIVQIATLISGTLVAQLITLLFIPFITRLYTPEEFGLYSLFFSIVNILGLVSSWKYDQAIMLPKSDKDAQSLIFLSISIIISMVIFITIGLLIFHNFITPYFNGELYYIWLIPFGVLLVGMLQVFNAYSSRKQFYKKLATVRVINSLTVSGVQGLSRYLFKLDGLVIGKLFADATSLFMLLIFHIKKETLQLSSLSIRRIKVNAKKYKHFPKYQTFTVFFNSLSQNIPILLLASLYSSEIAGLYALTVRVLQVPVRLIGSSTREVYYQKASKMYARGEDIFNLYRNTTIGLLKIFIVPFFIIILFGQEIFSIVFGDKWSQSGEIAQLLVLWFLFLFINSPSIVSFSILKLQKVQMKLEIISIILRFSSIYLGYYFYHSYWMSIIFFLISSIMINIYMIMFIYTKLKKDR